MANPTQEQLLDSVLMPGAHVRHGAAQRINPFEVSAGLRQSVHIQNWWRKSPGATHCGRYGASTAYHPRAKLGRGGSCESCGMKS